VEIAYTRGVKREGNLVAQKMVEKAFETCPADWRGLGIVPGSGLKLRRELAGFDADSRLPVKVKPPVEHKGCLCGEILRGVKSPADCKLFGGRCTPENPVGPCMVSAEGACSAHYQYGR
jgi:hydrogenase expression/formation protein HypD